MSSEIDYICSFFLCCCVTVECIISFYRTQRYIVEYNEVEVEYNEVEYNEIENVRPDVVHKPFIFEIVTEFDQTKSLYDQSNQTNCIICMDELKIDQSIVECLQCNKYVGHQECIQKWIDIQTAKYDKVKCPHCRSSEVNKPTL
jgi:hypothetical protein